MNKVERARKILYNSALVVVLTVSFITGCMTAGKTHLPEIKGTTVTMVKNIVMTDGKVVWVETDASWIADRMKGDDKIRTNKQAARIISQMIKSRLWSATMKAILRKPSSIFTDNKESVQDIISNNLQQGLLGMDFKGYDVTIKDVEIKRFKVLTEMYTGDDFPGD